MDFEEETLLLLLLLRIRRRRRKRRSILYSRMRYGIFHTLYPQLREDGKKFFNYFRISVASFDELANALCAKIQRTDTAMRKSIPPEERIAVTLRWVWECVKDTGSCQRRTKVNNNESRFYPSIEICRLVCGTKGNIWPMPQNYTQLSKSLVYINAKNTVFSLSAPNPAATIFLEGISQYFNDVIDLNKQQDCEEQVYQLFVKLNSSRSTLKLNWNTSDEYDLQISTDDQALTVNVDITAVTVFGARHGIETLLQLIEVYNDYEETCYLTLREVSIQDKPFYKHRGLLLDSARNYLSVETIKKNIVAMAMSKMNVLHWHISDSQSFPFVSSRLPNMSSYGAYSNEQVYAPYQIRDLIDFAKKHGVRIIPEIDGPAHTGNGWQWGPEAGLGNLVVCHNQQPWRSYCVQPPCGQLNPANPMLYAILQSLYADISDLWSESDVFHMGGDEVYFPCWNSSDEIINYIGTQNRSENTFLKLWGEFQRKALKAYDTAHRDSLSSIILWTSHLTQPEFIQSFLPEDRYVIQTWVPRNDSLPGELIKLGYKLIISTKDSWYLDHGFWGSTSFYNWRNVYNNKILTDKAVLGGEVCMWGELVDDNNVESRVWPRAAAAAERLWTNPETTAQEAEDRFFIHNSRLSKRGIRTSAVTPKFCAQSETDCENYLSYYYMG